MCVMKPSKVLGMVATMVTVLLMSFPILSAPQSRGTQCDNVPHDAYSCSAWTLLVLPEIKQCRLPLE